MLVPYKENLCSKYAEKMLSIKICNNCNMECSFCVDRGGRDGGNIDVQAIATEAIKREEYKTIIITGGEPFLVFYSVIALCKLLRQHKSRIVLNTNGSLLSEEKVLALNGMIDELQVSVHHYDEERNGNVFGKNISFNDMKKALSVKSFALSINSTFNKEYSQSERKDAPAFSCCFINNDGQKKIDVDTKDTFKVIYSDGLVTDDWIFNRAL
jgi:MoaA/NifB/PqqE/SkfB family radical SAM enzyme